MNIYEHSHLNSPKYHEITQFCKGEFPSFPAHPKKTNKQNPEEPSGFVLYGVFLHPPIVYIAKQKRPTLVSVIMVSTFSGDNPNGPLVYHTRLVRGLTQCHPPCHVRAVIQMGLLPWFCMRLFEEPVMILRRQ